MPSGRSMPSGRVSRFDGRRKTEAGQGEDRGRQRENRGRQGENRGRQRENRGRQGENRGRQREDKGRQREDRKPGQGDGSFVRIYHTKNPSPRLSEHFVFQTKKPCKKAMFMQLHSGRKAGFLTARPCPHKFILSFQRRAHESQECPAPFQMWRSTSIISAAKSVCPVSDRWTPSWAN